MKYISCFSGIGGLEGTSEPKAICEIDDNCRTVLKNRFPKAIQFEDIRSIVPPKVDVLAGGWPCQDLSVAGKQRGLEGENSGLFYSFVRAAVLAEAQTIIAENVPNLLRMQAGLVFVEVIKEFEAQGYIYCAWRTLNAREFGLPHNRNRVFIIASKNRSSCFSLFRKIPRSKNSKFEDPAAGFYWTAGSQSICYTKGYIPTIKVGSGLSIASPPAVHYKNVIRQITPSEALRLQGFNANEFSNISPSTIYKMAGNAVARPVGQFVVDGVLMRLEEYDPKYIPSQYDLFGGIIPVDGIPNNGFYEKGNIRTVETGSSKSLANNLSEFLDLNVDTRLSTRAAKGLLSRLDRSGLSCPEDLHRLLEKVAYGTENQD